MSLRPAERSRRPALILSVILLAAVTAAQVISLWWTAGWSMTTARWVVIQSSSMQELHTQTDVRWLSHARLEVLTTSSINSVIPAGAPVNEPAPTTAWIWERTTPTRNRQWESHWHLTRADHWRLGSLGYYQSSGGGTTSQVFSLPLSLIQFVVGMPLWHFVYRRIRSRWRRRKGRCPVCNYDRAGLADAASCPECAHSGT